MMSLLMCLQKFCCVLCPTRTALSALLLSNAEAPPDCAGGLFSIVLTYINACDKPGHISTVQYWVTQHGVSGVVWHSIA